MASSTKTTVTFANLPREIRNNIYKHMLTEPRTIDVCHTGVDYGQPEDLGTLRATLNACRKSPQFAREAFETFFRINTIRMTGEAGNTFLIRPVHYVQGRGFQPLIMLVQTIVIGVLIGHEPHDLSACLRQLLPCPVLRRVTVKVAFSMTVLDEGNPVQKYDRVDELTMTRLDAILAATSGIYQVLRNKIGHGLTFETRIPGIGDTIRAWEERMNEATVEES